MLISGYGKLELPCTKLEKQLFLVMASRLHRLYGQTHMLVEFVLCNLGLCWWYLMSYMNDVQVMFSTDGYAFPETFYLGLSTTQLHWHLLLIKAEDLVNDILLSFQFYILFFSCAIWHCFELCFTIFCQDACFQLSCLDIYTWILIFAWKVDLTRLLAMY